MNTMRLFQTSIVAAALSLSAIGCKESFTDLPLNGIQTVENLKVFDTPEGTVNYVNSCYSALNWDDWWQVQFRRMVFESATDDGWLGNTEQWGNAAGDLPVAHFQGLSPNDGNTENYWTFNYFGVQRANVGIERVATAPVNDALRKRLVAEMKFLRGWFYFELVKNWGDVPLYTVPRTANDTPVPRTPKAQVYEQIMNDFQEAAQDLPQRKDYTGLDKSRASKGAALAFLAKAALWAEKYDVAEQVAKQLMDLNEYSLEPEFGNIFQASYYNGPESIFEISSSVLNGNVRGVTAGSRSDGGWGWNVPSSNLESAFLAENDTVRLTRTIIKHGQRVWGDPAASGTGIFDARPSGNKSGRIWRKFYVPRGKRVVPNQSYQSVWVPVPYIFIRYGEVMLIYAEASARQGKAAQALDALNAIRRRAKLPVRTGLSGEALTDAIIAERRLELAGELSFRWDDLRRVRKNGKLLIASVLGPNGSFVRYNAASKDPFETATNTEPQNKGTLFREGVNELLPIPAREVNASNGVVTQNPGY
jgi:hypothetical protein